MTNHGDGGSPFIQTPAPDIQHQHFHHNVHHRRGAADAHLRMHLHHHRQHAQPVPKTPDPELDPPQNQDQDLRQRQIGGVGELDDLVTRVVRTVSVIKYLDGNGSTVDVSTVFSPPVTVVIDETTGKTSTLSPAGTLSSDLPLPPAATASSVLSPGSSPVSLSLPTSSSTSTSTSTSSDTSSGTSSGTSSSTTPAPTTFLSSLAPSSLRNSTTFPSLSGSFNSSSSSTALPFSNSTVRSFFANSSSSTQTSISFTTSESSSTSSTSFSSSSTSSSETTISSSTTTSETNGLLGPGGGPAAPTAPVAAPAPASDSPTSTPAIVGGVVGSICSVALLIFAVVFLLRWRKQQLQEAHKRLGEGDPAPPGSAGGFSTRMSQRGTPFAVPSALAALSGAGAATKQITSPQSTGGDGETSERGFYRVSGRKLPSVLQHGGDGYTNPHASVMSDESEIMYRDSQAFFSGVGGTRLAVGSPMRPESGIAVMNPGPARTPVPGQSPHLEASPTMSPPPAMASNPATPRDSLVPQPLRPTPPPPRLDAIGRSRPSMDGSRVSSSRFSEHLS
ncbi:hypothetical protein MAPG_09051 [Magnaporthiopsis poae ATCC 64411]|uniref:Uncharacterized protein n=1 Tax=Magnaporthiopsis poae (strain ATCC 64411 / 73-15) TaxID=644358 RepID=A0A0C4E8X9_MAGP6|nr:hypothetical protein MAPG_09051 [Magnaporthiopsis poae ATCC 64411]